MRSVLFVTCIVAIVAILLPNAAKTQMETKKYVVLAPKGSISSLSSTLKSVGAKARQLKYHNGYTTEMSEEHALTLKSAGYFVEEDGTAYAIEDTFKDNVEVINSEADSLGNCLRSIRWTTTYACANREPDPDPTPSPTPTPTPTNTPPSEQWPYGIKMVNSSLAHIITRGSGMKICIADTGISVHEDLPKPLAGMNFSSSGSPDDFDDRHGHGTHVSGTAAARENKIGVIGVAPLASLIAAKVLSDSGSGSWSGVAEGIRYCMEQGAHVISMSLGGSSGSSLVQQALKDAQAAGIISVCAAGNSRGPVGYPAKYPECVAVSAVDSAKRFASFSSFGPEVEYAAPGVGTLSTCKGNTYCTKSGTSMATPHVSGCFALAISRGKKTLVGVKQDQLTDDQEGKGLIDCLQSVR